MDAYQKHFGSFFVGLYGWALAIFLGMILLDIRYASLVPEAAGAFSEVADFLLLVGFAALLCAVAAIAFSWNTKIARNLLIASLAVILLEFSIPVFVSLFFRSAQALATIGPWLRVIPSAAASILALAGMVQYARQR